MSYSHCIITRFSFRFRKDDPHLPLLSEERMEERLRIFEHYCFPSIIHQTNPNFYWILIIDPLLPDKYREALERLIHDFKNSDLYQTHGPREIWIHIWDWDNKLGQIDWILPYFEKYWIKMQKLSLNGEAMENVDLNWIPPKYLVTTRLDDDDSLVFNFTDIVKSQLTRTPKVKDFRYLSFCVGYYYYSNNKTLRMTKSPMIALGLTLITVIDKYPLCVYLGSHTKIPNFIKKPELNKIMNQYHQKNRDGPITRTKVMDRLYVIRSGPPIYVRNVHDFNLQKNITRHRIKNQNLNKVKDILKKKFHVNIE